MVRHVVVEMSTVPRACASGAAERSINPQERTMMIKLSHVAGAVLALASVAAFAQTNTAETVQRDVNQQTRIEQGLQGGKLSTREAARLEKEQAQVDRLQAKSLKDGKLTAVERAKLDAAQDKTSRDIYAAKHNGVSGNPQSASSQRMQADVQRNINQDKRIEAGVQNGSLNNREVGKLERGQAKVSQKEFAAGRDGHVGAAEQHRVQKAENRQSKRIYKQKHDAQVRNPA
jgi:hypothetical protein